MNAVAAGFCADVNHRIADTLGLGEENVFFARDAERERVDQRILRVARLERNLAADRGNAEAIAVVADAADYAVEDAAVGGKSYRVV